MVKKTVSVCLGCLLLFLAACLLRFPYQAFYYSAGALNLWFEKMIPALLPFMMLSGLLIRMHLTGIVTACISPFLGPLFRVRSDCLYVIITGFLCGFPMGARTCRECLEQKKITKKEAQFLLAFCNNIGPIYLTGYVFLLFPEAKRATTVLLFYGVPLIYGLLLRYIGYRDLEQDAISTVSEKQVLFGEALHQTILSSLEGITILGGYMIFWNLLNLPLHLIPIPQKWKEIFGCLLEITSGLSGMDGAPVGMSMGLLTFGGFSCMAQTYVCIKGTGLSLTSYLIHKIIQTVCVILLFGIMVSVS